MNQKQLQEKWNYDPNTGLFSSKHTGKVIGSLQDNGYIVIPIKTKLIKAHQAAVIYMGVEIPEGYIVDHINGIRSDNRFCNLRIATKAENSYNRKKNRNNTSGYKGVYWNHKNSKWQASVKTSGKRFHLGLFVNAEDADAACRAFREATQGEFARHD